MSIRVVLADDHQILREGLCSLIEKEPDIKVIAQTDNGRDAVRICREQKPNIVVMDVTMPGLNGIEAAHEIVKEMPEVKVLGLSMHSDRQFISRMLEAGASGFLLKNCAATELVTAIRALYGGRSYLSQEILDMVVKDYPERINRGTKKTAILEVELSPREKETLQLLAEGKSQKEIASLIGVSIKSVEVYRKALSDKLGIHDMAGLIKYAIRQGLTEL